MSIVDSEVALLDSLLLVNTLKPKRGDNPTKVSLVTNVCIGNGSMFKIRHRAETK